MLAALMLLYVTPRSRSQAIEIEAAGRAFLKAYKQLHILSIRQGNYRL